VSQGDTQKDEYSNLVDGLRSLKVGAPAGEADPVWLLALDGRWFRAQRRVVAPRVMVAGVWLGELGQTVVAGMSGSPILGEDGNAIGVVSLALAAGDTTDHDAIGSQANLAAHLPSWLWGVLTNRRRIRLH
jgi:hypothetical protein